jgi:anti-sigma regulatory factor (Ser/Thr protein kinase)
MASRQQVLQTAPRTPNPIAGRPTLESSWNIARGAEGDRYAIELLARRIALADGYPHSEAVLFAYAASELASNLARHGGGGTLKMAAESHALTLEARNANGNGLLGDGRGVGLEGVRSVMDELEFVDDEGTLVVIARRASKYVVTC